MVGTYQTRRFILGGYSGPERPEKHLRRVFHGSQGLQNIYSQVLDVAVLARYYQWNVEASAPIHACGHGVDPPHFTKSVPFHTKAPIFWPKEGRARVIDQEFLDAIHRREKP